MKRSVIALVLATALSVTVLPSISARSAGTVHETTVTETEFGEINNLVSRKQEVNGAMTSVSTNGALVSGSGGYVKSTIYVDEGDRVAYIVDTGNDLLDSSASLTVRYNLIGCYYPGRKTLDDGTVPINIGAEVTISNPENLTRIALFENFWYGGLIRAVGGRPGGRADYSITFFNADTGEAVLLGTDARLVASSLDGWPIEPKISYEGISFYNADETWVSYRSDGNITYDPGDLFGVPAYYTGERKADYEDTMDHKTFINCGVSFWQNSTTWKCAFVTQTDHSDGHGDWFYFAATPTNLLRPARPEKKTDQASYHVGDKGVYTISQTGSLTPDEGYGSYGSFQFIDRLPAGLDYVSAEIACSDGAVPDTAGDIVYDAGSRTATYTFTSEYLRALEYRGQIYTFTVVCRINEAALGGQAFANTAEVAINGEVVTTPAAAVTPYYCITTEVVGGTIDAGISAISAGENKTISYRPNTGWRLESVIVDGVAQDISRFADGYSFTDIRANHHIRVVYVEVPTDRNVRLTKRIKASDIVFDHGYPTFLFKLEGTDVFGRDRVCYRAVTFTPEYVSANTAGDGYVSCTAVFSDLVPGTYTATEEATNRYVLAGVTEVSGGRAEGSSAVFDLTGVQQGTAVFTNDKYEQGGFSDSSFVENILK